MQRPNLPHFPSEERFRGPYPQKRGPRQTSSQPENKAPHLDEKWHGYGYLDTEKLKKRNRMPLMELPSYNRGVDSRRRHCLGQKGLEQMGAKEGTPTAAGSIYEGSQLLKENNQAPSQHHNRTRGTLSRGHKNRKSGNQGSSSKMLSMFT